MSYKDVLAEVVEKSGKSLRKIAEECKQYHVDIDPSYISKLQTGKQGPPNDRITEALAKVCGGNADYLLFEAYMDKGPEPLKKTILKLAEAYRNFIKSQLSKAPSNEAQIKVESLDRTKDWELIQLILKWGPGMGLIPLEETREKMKMLCMKDGEIAEEDIEIVRSELFRIEMWDGSMQPIVPKGSKVQLDSSVEIESGDIVIVGLPNRERVIRRYIPVGKKVVLVPENKAYKAQEFDVGKLTIYGKVKEVIIEL